MGTTVSINDVRFCFMLCALFPRSSDYWAPSLHSHTNFEVLYEAAGCTRLSQTASGGGRFTLTPPNYTHAASFATDGAIYTTSFTFSVVGSEKSPSDLTRRLFALKAPRVIPDTFGGVELLKKCAELATDEERSLTLLLLLIRLCDEVPLSGARALTRPCGTPETDVIDNYIDEHMSDPLFSCAELAAHLHVSERQLYRVLNATYRMSFRQLLSRARMSMARAMLTSTDASIDEIVRRTGYSSAASLAHAYRAYYGVTLRRRVRPEA